MPVYHSVSYQQLRGLCGSLQLEAEPTCHSEAGKLQYYRHKKIPGGGHGTGDVYASAFTGALSRGLSVFDAAKIAADFTVLAIENTLDDKSHWYGVKFEKSLLWLAQTIETLATK